MSLEKIDSVAVGSRAQNSIVEADQCAVGKPLYRSMLDLCCKEGVTRTALSILNSIQNIRIGTNYKDVVNIANCIA